jgi:hypothetical protein
MHDLGAAVAEPDDAPLRRIGAAGSSQAGVPLTLPELLDTRLVRVELTRLRTPRQGSEQVGLGRARIARSQETGHGGHPG